MNSSLSFTVIYHTVRVRSVNITLKIASHFEHVPGGYVTVSYWDILLYQYIYNVKDDFELKCQPFARDSGIRQMEHSH